jgi:AcrR family transcriptional regulator
MTARAAEKSARRTEILSAAKEVFADRGYEATTIADIARAAGLSYGSVYWYFESKESLFHALMQAEAHALREHVNLAMTGAPERSSADAFRAAVRATFEFFESDRAAVKLLFRDAYWLGHRSELSGIFEGFVSDIEASVLDAQSRGQVAGFYPARLVAFSMAALIGQVALRRAVTDDGLRAGEVADFLVSLLLEGLVPRRGRSRR